jgi:hypothetical protein
MSNHGEQLTPFSRGMRALQQGDQTAANQLLLLSNKWLEEMVRKALAKFFVVRQHTDTGSILCRVVRRLHRALLREAPMDRAQFNLWAAKRIRWTLLTAKDKLAAQLAKRRLQQFSQDCDGKLWEPKAQSVAAARWEALEHYEKLTEKQQQVMELWDCGSSVEEIATTLGITPDMVERHKLNAYLEL